MTGTSAVRTLRYELAKALLATGSRHEEAVRQIDLALRETGDEPPDWLLLAELGRLERDDDPARAARHLVHATLAAPPAELRRTAEQAADVLDGMTDGVLRDAVSDGDVDRLRDRARSDDAPGVVVRLAANLLIGRGDTGEGLDLLATKPSHTLPGDDLQRTADAAAHLRALIDDDRWDEIDGLLAADDLLATAAGLEADRALVHYAQGRSQRALEELGGRQNRFEEAAVRVLVDLQEAAGETGAERQRLAEEALEMAVAATQLAPLSAEGSLLRAQAMLEGALDIEEGRRLLRRAVRRLSFNLESVAWWRAQERVRRDEFYGYFRIETDAALKKPDEVLRRVGAATLSKTEYAQDGAISELKAQILADRGDRAGAAEAYRLAAVAHRHGSDRPRAIKLMEQAVAYGSTEASVLDLIELLWQASFPLDRGGDGDAEAAERALGHVAAVGEPSSTEIAIRTCFLTGLALGRHAEQTRQAEPRWMALPHLLAAALVGHTDPYPYAHTAWAMHAAGLWRPAWHFADLAAAGGGTSDAWLAQTAVSMRFGWAGRLDPARADLLDAVGDPAWQRTMVAFDQLLGADPEELASFIETDEPADLWTRQIRAYATARRLGFDESVPRFSAILKDSLAAGDADAAADSSMVLGNYDTARQQLELAEKAGEVDRCSARLKRSLLGFLDGTDGTAAEVERRLRQVPRPFLRRTYAYVDLPLLAEATADRPAVSSELSALAARLRAEPDPVTGPLVVELDHGCAQAPDPVVGAAVRSLLVATSELARGDRGAAVEAVAGIQLQPQFGAASFRWLLAEFATRARVGQ